MIQHTRVTWSHHCIEGRYLSTLYLVQYLSTTLLKYVYLSTFFLNYVYIESTCFNKWCPSHCVCCVSHWAKYSNVDLTILKYLDETDHSLTSFHRHPLLNTMFVKFNTDLPSCASVGRIFSLAGVTVLPRRNRLSAKCSKGW